MIYKNSTLYLIVTLLAISALILGLIIGCDEKQVKSPVVGSAAGSGPVGGGDAQNIRLTANPSSTITAVGEEQATAQITAIVENNIGQPMPDGTVVYWTATVGELDSVTTTTSNGASTVTLTFPGSFTGSSVITATAGDATASITINVVNVTPTPTITTTPTPTTGFVVSAAQTTIAHHGTTTITAYVTRDGEPESGVQVNFSVSGAGILQKSAAITGADGKASVVLTGNNISTSDQTATVTATTADGRSGTVSVIVTGGATPTPTSTTTPSIGLVVTVADTIIGHGEEVTVTALVHRDGQPESGVQVNFSVSGAGTLQQSAAITDATGNATVTLVGKNTSTTTDQTATVTATTKDGRSGSVAVIVEHQ